MEFKIDVDTLKNVISRISRIVPTVTYNFIFKGVKFEVRDEKINIFATDGTVSIKECINKNDTLEIIETGDFIVDGKVIASIVQKMEKGWVRFKEEKASVILETSYMRTNLNKIVSSSFPYVDFQYSNNFIDVNFYLFDKAISSISCAACDKESRPVLQGIHFEILKDNLLRLTATDSYRVAIYHVDITQNSIIKNMVLTVPLKILNMASILFDEKDLIRLYFNDSEILIKNGNCFVKSVLLEGTYPDIQQLIPSTFKLEVKIKSDKFLKAVDRSSFLKNDGISIIHIKINEDGLILSSTDKEIGEYHEYVAIENNERIIFEFYINGKYLKEALNSLDNDVMLLKLNDRLKPFVLEKDKSKKILQVLLPINVRSE